MTGTDTYAAYTRATAVSPFFLIALFLFKHAMDISCSHMACVRPVRRMRSLLDLCLDISAEDCRCIFEVEEREEEEDGGVIMEKRVDVARSLISGSLALIPPAPTNALLTASRAPNARDRNSSASTL